MKVIKAALILFLACFVILVWNLWSSHSISITKDQMKTFISVVDEVSVGKIQVNWKDVAAVSAVRNDGDFESISDDKIKETANVFIGKQGNQFTLRTIDEVINQLDFDAEQMKSVKQYSEYLNDEVVYSHKLNENLNKNFIASIKDAAIDNFLNYGVLPSITISQAILESDWGRSQLAVDYNNLFGIKDHRKWQGETASLKTTEFYDKQIQANFRAYDSISQSVKDHGLFLSENPRYTKNGLFSSKTYIEQAKALENAGYSTAEDEQGNKMYSRLLIQLIQQYELQLIDSAVYQQQA
ncbi:glycoside hydrolase family 73 protein [Bacillus massiliigorillae]|uniref:glycoside hydrolase family 73 protein n=1 Tax=Bacillus massiliigorillae TaxID=1243664 RepID=UPI0003A3B697|nr:glucosaminidase domain-containing protein [Bacillus massiliigorillae]